MKKNIYFFSSPGRLALSRVRPQARNADASAEPTTTAGTQYAEDDLGLKDMTAMVVEEVTLAGAQASTCGD